MSISNHIQELMVRHSKLDEKIEEAQKAPGFCSIELKRLKKQKLHLKDRIAKISSGVASDALVPVLGETVGEDGCCTSLHKKNFGQIV